MNFKKNERIFYFFFQFWPLKKSFQIVNSDSTYSKTCWFLIIRSRMARLLIKPLTLSTLVLACLRVSSSCAAFEKALSLKTPKKNSNKIKNKQKFFFNYSSFTLRSDLSRSRSCSHTRSSATPNHHDPLHSLTQNRSNLDQAPLRAHEYWPRLSTNNQAPCGRQTDQQAHA